MTATPTDAGVRLLALARASIANALGLGPAPRWDDDPALRARGATFVTLTLDDELRGCIGSLKPHRTLGEDVVANARAAALEDPRFPPLSAAEFGRVHIGVSLLSPSEFIDFADEAELLGKLRPGVDGLTLFSGCGGATFLPQVWEQLPEPAQFLAALKRKAGLDPARPAAGLMAARYTVEKWDENPEEVE
ncbi:MAG: AmmeMemoRadiSam system protein A [Thauera phenolivorans]|uniref:AmmeMemoRadiSam system protein A n=1 Tax=Thauera phenolivorans TaxID=1792543 RepID=A0A7X7LTY7_9RHOO|nr:AmmeMemoRadiSam system protein A [Thauera phenolivorans]NLF53359.1 AmmeMemoRadiSam system protein A [Thauera phenolivorans]